MIRPQLLSNEKMFLEDAHEKKTLKIEYNSNELTVTNGFGSRWKWRTDIDPPDRHDENTPDTVGKVRK